MAAFTCWDDSSELQGREWVELCCCQDSLSGSASLLEVSGIYTQQLIRHDQGQQLCQQKMLIASPVVPKIPEKEQDGRKVLSCPKNHSGGSRDKLDLKDNSIHLGQDTYDSPGKGRWLWQQPVRKHQGWKKGSSKKSIASSTSLFGFLHPSPLSVNPCTTLSFFSGAMESGCPAAPGEEEAPRKGPVVLLGGCKPSLGQPLPLPALPAAHRAALPSRPASSAAENELGRWQSVSGTLQSWLFTAPCCASVPHRLGTAMVCLTTLVLPHKPATLCEPWCPFTNWHTQPWYLFQASFPLTTWHSVVFVTKRVSA